MERCVYMQVVAGRISSQSLLVWDDTKTQTDATLTNATLTVGEGATLRVTPRDQYMNVIDGGGTLQIVVPVEEAPSNTTSITTSAIEFDGNKGNYTGDVSLVFPEGWYSVYVDILADNIRLGPLMLQAMQLPCNDSKHLTASTISATCVCMVGAALTGLEQACESAPPKHCIAFTTHHVNRSPTKAMDFANVLHSFNQAQQT